MIKITHTDGRVVEQIETNHEIAAINFLAHVLPMEFNCIAHYANMKTSILENGHKSAERRWEDGWQVIHTIQMRIEE